MPLPSGQISFSQVNVELGLSATAQISLNDAAVRTLAGVPSGAISMQNLQGKANASDFAASVAKPVGYVEGSTTVYSSVAANQTAIYTKGVISLGEPSYTYHAAVGSYSPTGTLNWLKGYAATGYSSSTLEEYKLLGLDGSGNIYALFKFGNSGSSILKLNSSGGVIWAKLFAIGNENASMSIDSSGNIYVSTSSGGSSASLVKIDTNGAIVWSKSFANTTLRVVHVSSSYVYVGGITYGSPYITLAYRFDLNGNLVDNKAWNAGTYGYVGAITTDSSENIYIGMVRDFGSGSYYAVYQRFNSSWTFNWSTGPYFYVSGSQVYPREITVDSAGNSYCTVRSGSATFITAKMNSSGTVQWIRRWYRTSSVNGGKESWEVAVTPTGKIATSGYINFGSFNNKAFLSVVPADGSKTGTYTLDGESVTYDASPFTYSDGGQVGTTTVTRTISNAGYSGATDLTITTTDLTTFVKSTVQL